MTEQDEKDYIEKIANICDLNSDTVASVINAQLALFMTQLCINKHVETLFGNIYVKNGEFFMENPNQQVVRLSSAMEVSKKLINELPSDVKNVM